MSAAAAAAAASASNGATLAVPTRRICEKRKCHVNKGVVLGAAVVGAGGAYLYERHKCNKRRCDSVASYGPSTTTLLTYSSPPAAAAAAAAAAAPAISYYYC